jgi:PD-(D/E)XK nuclease superfamily protein
MPKLSLTELRKKPHHSFSSLNRFLNICSLQYAFNYVYRIPQEHTPVNLVFGSAFHRTLEVVARCRRANELVSIDSAAECFSDYWITLCDEKDDIKFKSPEQFDGLHATGRKMITVFMESWPEYDIIEVSPAFSVPLPGSDKPLIGEYDCVLRDANGNIVIVDWKTAARRWPKGKADKDLQATCFSYAYRIENGAIPEFRFDVITKTKVPTYEQHYTCRTPDSFVRLNKLVEMVERATAADAFYPNESSYACADCVYKHACASWHHQQVA